MNQSAEPTAAEPTPQQVLDREFLETRAKVLDIAAALDRIDRAGPLPDDPRAEKLRTAIEALLAPGPGRAERVQLLFSLPYEGDWRERFQLIDESSSVN